MIRNNYFKVEVNLQSIIFVYLVIYNDNLDIKKLGFEQMSLCMDSLHMVIYRRNIPLETVFTFVD